MKPSFRIGRRYNKMTYNQIKAAIPLYSVLASSILDFLEPCVDYDVPQCIHIKCLQCVRHVCELRQGGNCTVDECKSCDYLILSDRDYKTINDFIDDGAQEFMVAGPPLTLHELYDKVGGEFGTVLDAINCARSRGESRSLIRNVCRRVGEFLDGSPIDFRDKQVQPRRENNLVKRKGEEGDESEEESTTFRTIKYQTNKN